MPGKPDKPGGRRSGRRGARRLAMQALYQWQLTGQDLRDIEKQFLDSPEAARVDRDYFCRLVSLVRSDQPAIREIVIEHADRPAEQLDPVEFAILLVGAAELKHVPDVPYRVVINEAVELARAFGAEDGHKYVNALLDKAAATLRSAERAAAARSR